MKAALDETVTYEVMRSPRTTADIVIEPDGRVLVRAPKHLTEAKIASLVRAKRRWIHTNLATWRELNATRVERVFRNGESFLYLGRNYRLSLVGKQDEPLVLKGGRFLLCRSVLAEGGEDGARKAFEAYYTARGCERIVDRVSYFAPKVGVQAKRVSVREMGRRWASCSASGNLAFHWKCMMAPPQILDYIVVHELCHFHHLDHSDAFWNEIDKVMPAFGERKEWLRKNGARLDV